MALPTRHFFARISTAARAALAFGINRLCIDDRCTGTGITPSGHPSRPASPVAEPLKEVYLPPFSEVMHSLARSELVGEHSPLAAAFHQVKHSVDQPARIMFVKPEAIKDRLDAFPFCVGQVIGIAKAQRSEAIL
ncbi:hypothetical protein GGP95_001223 [Salinibacter ruber]|nr:hypothetical protein [Salinibacter ruber]MCS4150720.1 hypothetical protein [Salinibacter ruber]